ncbi:unnamed protein product [Gongylonema pulchrum]|uniref:Uncharacterized protein n=1 Tax=Gongylonema pulchrum TaxID=637853 RepID=A0A183DL22_9BILA|nr:unnamed protein product [Gongylonema pulchrum]
MKKLRIKSSKFSDDAVQDWDYASGDPVFSVHSRSALIQTLRFQSFNNFGAFLDIVPAYVQYLIGQTHFFIKSSTEHLFVCFSYLARYIILMKNTLASQEYLCDK